MLPPNYLDGARQHSQSLAVFKGSLALIVLGEYLGGGRDICHIWVMREYGVVESWTKESVLVDGFEKFFCCTGSGELLIHTFQRGFVSYDPESLNWNKLLILRPPWLSYTADLMESLVLLDQFLEDGNVMVHTMKLRWNLMQLCVFERNPREATNTSSYARPLCAKYPSLPSWVVQVTNDFGEGETMIVPYSKHVPYVPWTGGMLIFL
uniref:F-box associated domain-containing protein n=1 Tax=Fagus sylvatica TaxID=28930 RepID=A0A2N9I0I6_FAGSY